MLFNIQFPIIDLRTFLVKNTRLESPAWPMPRYNEFIRSFGNIKNRPIHSLPEIQGTKFCSGRRAVRFEPYFSTKINIFCKDDDSGDNVILKHRRYYFDGMAAGKYEFSFEIPWFDRNYCLIENINELINAFLQLKVRVFVPTEKPVMIKLYDFPKHFVKLLNYATSRLIDIKNNNISQNRFLIGTPLIFIQLKKKEYLPLVRNMEKTNVESLGSECFHKNYYYNDLEYRILILRTPNLVYDNNLHHFALYLEQIHYLKEALYGILRATQKKLIDPGLSPDISNYFQEFFRQKIHYFKKKSANLDNDLLELALATTDILQQGERQDLLTLLKNVLCIRPNIYKNIVRMIELLDLASKTSEAEAAKKILEAQQACDGNKTVSGNIRDMAFSDYKSDIDWQRLKDALSVLKSELNKMPDYKVKKDLIILDKAIIETEKKRSYNFLKNLSKIGKFGLGVAKDIGVDILTAMIKKAAEIP